MPEKKYTIKKGDSLWGIASRNGLTLQELMDINGITDSKYHLEPGAELFITKRSTMEQVPQQSDSLFGRLFRTNSTAPEPQPSWTPTGTQGSMKGKTAQQYNKETGEWEKTTQCARWANDALRQYEGQYDDKHIHGDAWTRLRKGKMLYSGYTDKQDTKNFSEQASDMRNHTAADNLRDNFDLNSLDPSKVYMVNMYYDSSPSKEKAWKEGSKGTTGTHTGNLYYDSKSKSWKVAHNIHGTIINDNLSKVLGSRNGKGYGITAIAEAKARNNGSGLINKVQGTLYDIGLMESGGNIIKSVTGNTSKGSPFIEGPRRKPINQAFNSVGDFFGNMGSHLKSTFASKSYVPQLKKGDDYRNAIVVRKSNHNLYYYDNDGNLAFQTKVATGANSGQKQQKGDSRTPVGKFSISSFEQNRDPEVFGANKFYRLNTGRWTGIGIHGDANFPEQIGRNASHGCVRLPNDKLEELIGILGNNYRKNVYILDENDQYKKGGRILFGQKGTPVSYGGQIASAVVFPKKEDSAWDGNSFVGKYTDFFKNTAQRVFRSPDESYIRLNDYKVGFEDVNKPQLEGQPTIVGNIFINDTNPNTVGTPDSFYSNQPLGDDNVSADRYSRWMGVQDGKFIVGDKSMFGSDTLITPVVNKDLPITKSIDNQYNFGSIGGKFIIYSGNGENATVVTSNDKVRDVNRFVAENQINEENPAHLIQLDSGRYNVGVTKDTSQYVRNDLPRKDRIWGFTIR